MNWDIGNSLPTGETPLQFYENLKDHIYNIHIKDYKLVKNENSIEFHRCIIGKGNINIDGKFHFFILFVILVFLFSKSSRLYPDVPVFDSYDMY